MKKRGGGKPPQQQILDEAAKANIRYQTLLTQFLQLQKENVRRQRKLRTTKQKGVVLSSEVRFLRRRLRFLKMKNSDAIEEAGHVHNQTVNVESEVSDMVPPPPTNPNVERKERKKLKQ